ncbi:nucleoside triphosphate pyrophosphohydrolase [Vibrio phage vB_VcorM_GR7B]|nr:nucleoside triphosphate pyrophosphohydrolase [Vibrio phage vB_VcorM_GR7B]
MMKALIGQLKKLREHGSLTSRDLTNMHRKFHEESGEVVEALLTGDMENLREELGDVLFHVLFISILAEEQGHFNLQDVIGGLTDKLSERNPDILLVEKGSRVLVLSPRTSNMTSIVFEDTLDVERTKELLGHLHPTTRDYAINLLADYTEVSVVSLGGLESALTDNSLDYWSTIDASLLPPIETRSIVQLTKEHRKSGVNIRVPSFA